MDEQSKPEKVKRAAESRSQAQSRRSNMRRAFRGGRPRGFSPKPEGPRTLVGVRLLQSEVDVLKRLDPGFQGVLDASASVTEGVRELLRRYATVEWTYFDNPPPLHLRIRATSQDAWQQCAVRLYEPEVMLIRDLGAGFLTDGLRELIRRTADVPFLDPPKNLATIPQAPSLLPEDLDEDAPLSAKELAALDAETDTLNAELGAGMTSADVLAAEDEPFTTLEDLA